MRLFQDGTACELFAVTPSECGRSRGYDCLRSPQNAQQVIIAGSQVPTVVLQQTTPQRRPIKTEASTAQSEPVLVAIDIAKARHVQSPDRQIPFHTVAGSLDAPAKRGNHVI